MSCSPCSFFSILQLHNHSKANPVRYSITNSTSTPDISNLDLAWHQRRRHISTEAFRLSMRMQKLHRSMTATKFTFNSFEVKCIVPAAWQGMAEGIALISLTYHS